MQDCASAFPSCDSVHCHRQAAEAEVAESADADELYEEFEEVKRARTLSSIFDKDADDDVLKVDASQSDESLAVHKDACSCAPDNNAHQLIPLCNELLRIIKTC